MKCPGCKYVCADKIDICPKCLIDLRSHKEILGLPVTSPDATYDALIDAQMGGGKKSGKNQSFFGFLKGIIAKPKQEEEEQEQKPSKKTTRPKKKKKKQGKKSKTTQKEVKAAATVEPPKEEVAPVKSDRAKGTDSQAIDLKSELERAEAELDNLEAGTPIEVAEPFDTPTPTDEIDTALPEDLFDLEAKQSDPTEIAEEIEPIELDPQPEPSKTLAEAPRPSVLDLSGDDGELSDLLDQMIGDTEIQYEAVKVEKKEKPKDIYDDFDDDDDDDVDFDFEVEFEGDDGDSLEADSESDEDDISEDEEEENELQALADDDEEVEEFSVDSENEGIELSPKDEPEEDDSVPSIEPQEIPEVPNITATVPYTVLAEETLSALEKLEALETADSNDELEHEEEKTGEEEVESELDELEDEEEISEEIEVDSKSDELEDEEENTEEDEEVDSELDELAALAEEEEIDDQPTVDPQPLDNQPKQPIQRTAPTLVSSELTDLIAAAEADLPEQADSEETTIIEAEESEDATLVDLSEYEEPTSSAEEVEIEQAEILTASAAPEEDLPPITADAGGLQEIIPEASPRFTWTPDAEQTAAIEAAFCEAYDQFNGDDDSFEMSINSFRSIEDSEQVRLLFELAAEVIDDPNAQDLYRDDIVISDKREVEASALSQELKRVETVINRPLMSLKQTKLWKHTARQAGDGALDGEAAEEVGYKVDSPDLNTRLRAALTDLALVCAWGFAASVLYIATFESTLWAVFFKPNEWTTLQKISLVSIVLAGTGLMSFVYPVVSLVIFRQSKGKERKAIKVVRSSGAPLTNENAAIRSCCQAASILCFGYVPVLFGRRALHDYLAGTDVTRYDPKAEPELPELL